MFAELVAAPRGRAAANTERAQLTDAERIALAGGLLNRTLNAPGVYGDGMSRTAAR